MYCQCKRPRKSFAFGIASLASIFSTVEPGWRFIVIMMNHFQWQVGSSTDIMLLLWERCLCVWKSTGKRSWEQDLLEREPLQSTLSGFLFLFPVMKINVNKDDVLWQTAMMTRYHKRRLTSFVQMMVSVWGLADTRHSK